MEQDPQPGLDATLIDRLLAQNRTDLIAIAQRVLRDRHEAEDVVQDTLAATLARLPEIAPDKLSHYLHRAVRQNALKRKARRRKYADLKNVGKLNSIANSQDLAELDPLDLETAISSLPMAQQHVLRMKYYLGMSFRQIGGSLSISTHTAASRCRYAIEKLRSFLNR